MTNGIIIEKLGNIHKKAFTLSVLCMLSGCAVTNDYQPPDVNVPSEWRASYQRTADTETTETPGQISLESATALADTAWWENFEDGTLNDLIKTALNENKDLRIAIANVEEFGWRVQSTRSRYYPQAGYGAVAFLVLKLQRLCKEMRRG